MSLLELNELLEEMDETIKEFSDVLVTQLALREELEYEKEMKNQFISALVGVQNKIKGKKKQTPTNNKKKIKIGIEPGKVGFGLVRFASRLAYLLSQVKSLFTKLKYLFLSNLFAKLMKFQSH